MFQAEERAYAKAQKKIGAYLGECGSPNMDGAWVAWQGVAQEASKDQPNCQIEMFGHYLRPLVGNH